MVTARERGNFDRRWPSLGGPQPVGRRVVGRTIGVNVVFTDLVGSTELSSRLGPDATEALRVVHFGLLRGAAEPLGGVEVKNLGDGLMLVFPSLGAALDASVAMQQAIERHNSNGKEELGIRVGIATGDATEEDGDYFGEPVVEAARLCAHCEAGQIIVSQLTSMLARTSGHTFEPVGELALRGVPEPVPAMTVEWEPAQILGAVPIPDRLVPDRTSPLAGRRQHLDSLRQALKEAESGTRRVSLLAGEPGAGKTRLSTEIAVEAHGQGALVLYGRCDEELSLPYQPWVEAISHVLATGPSELVDELISLHGSELSLLIPQIRSRFPMVEAPRSTDPETERYHLLQAVTSLIGVLADEQTVVLVIDDLHWADQPTLTMLRHVFTNVAKSSLMVIGTYRDSDLEAGHPLIDTLAALRREPGVEQLNVRGLDDQEMVELVRNAAEHELDSALTEMAHALRRETAGNAFFAHEILVHLVEVGDIYLGESGQWEVGKDFEDLQLPQSVRDVVGQRIARLGEESLKALRAAAVIGKEFDLELLAKVIDHDEDDLLDLLEAAIAATVVAEVPGHDERFRFLHALTRNTLQGELSDGRRRRLHRKIADALEESYGADPGDHVSELATHWLAASVSVDNDKATRYVRMAGQRAEAALAPDEAIRWFVTALENLEDASKPDDRLHAELLVELGTAQRNAGHAGHRQTLLDAGERAKALNATDLMVAAALANGRGFLSKLGYKDEERVAALDAAILGVGPAPTSERALLLSSLAGELEYASPYEDRRVLIDEAVDIARGLDDQLTLGTVLNRFAVSFSVPHTLEERQETTAEARAIAEELGDLTTKFWAACAEVQVAMQVGNRVDLDDSIQRLIAAGEESGRPSYRWVASNLTCTALSTEGKAAEMEQQAEANLVVGTDADEPDAFDYYAAAIMAARWYQGRGMEVAEQMRETAARDVEVSAYPAALAVFLVEANLLDEAQLLFDAAKEVDFQLRVNNVWSTSIAAWGAVAEQLGDRDAAENLRDQLTPFAGQIIGNRGFTGWSVSGVLGRLESLLGNVDAAEEHFAAAEALVDRIGAHYIASFDDLGRARMHQRHGRPEDAEKAVFYSGRAAEAARTHGFAMIEHLASELRDSVVA
jgi:class 3 adenylate cyclase/tetratricopeptide (TPR) repeat protein